MAYKNQRQRQEDPNAESRTLPPSTRPVMPPAAPYVQNPAGGAPRTKTPGIGVKPGGPPPIVGPGGTQTPGIGVAGPPAVVGPGGTQSGVRSIKPYQQYTTTPFAPIAQTTPPWQNTPPPATPAPSIAASRWTLKD